MLPSSTLISPRPIFIWAAPITRWETKKNAQVHLALAHRGLDRVTERERYLILGADYDNQGNYEKAAEQYRLLTDLYPDDVEGYRWLANSSVWAGHLGDAVTAQQRAVKLAPRSAVNHSQLIVLLVRLNKFSEAVAAYGIGSEDKAAKKPSPALGDRSCLPR